MGSSRNKNLWLHSFSTVGIVQKALSITNTTIPQTLPPWWSRLPLLRHCIHGSAQLLFCLWSSQQPHKTEQNDINMYYVYIGIGRESTYLPQSKQNFAGTPPSFTMVPRPQYGSVCSRVSIPVLSAKPFLPSLLLSLFWQLLGGLMTRRLPPYSTLP
jgi:hypothetical protein